MRAQTPHPDWIRPDWPAPPGVHALFTTRLGGVSQAPFDSMNLGRPSGDDARSVDANRARLQSAIGAQPIYLSQVHGTHSVELADVLPPGKVEADACTSARPGIVCTMRVADCLPVLLTDRSGVAVAAAHAGWRGLARGVLEANHAQFAALVAGRTGGDTAQVAHDTLAWLGPCIGPRAFEVGGEVRAAFLQADPAANGCFTALAGDKWLADLAALARRRLQALGVTEIYGNDSGPDWCTFGNPSRFFSHRRDNLVLGGSGRMAACIWLA